MSLHSYRTPILPFLSPNRQTKLQLFDPICYFLGLSEILWRPRARCWRTGAGRRSHSEKCQVTSKTTAPYHRCVELPPSKNSERTRNSSKKTLVWWPNLSVTNWFGVYQIWLVVLTMSLGYSIYLQCSGFQAFWAEQDNVNSSDPEVRLSQ